MKSKTLVDSAGEKYSIKLRTLREHNDTLDIVLETGGFIELSKSKVEQLVSVLKEAHLNMGTKTNPLRVTDGK